MSACDDCLRRTWLIARLAGRIELARHERRPLREILALPDERLLAAVGGAEQDAIASALEGVEPEAMRAAAEEHGLEQVCRHEAGYPARLHDLVDAPAVLHVAGEAGALDRLAGGDLEEGARAVAVVGTRRASPDGLEVARGLGRGLGAAGVTVVSGMALGVDSAAHAGALETGGPTVAVLAGGAERAYPRSKRALRERIVHGGCVVSEMPPGSEAFRWCFPARNRLIAALGQMTVVVEAAERSGSLITAECATDIGREVGAVPGPVTSWRSRGTNALLRDGATLIRDTRDVLDAVLGVEAYAQGLPDPAVAGLEPRLRAVLGSVEGGRDTVAALAAAGQDARAVLGALTELELLGLLRRAPGGRYVRVAA
ncbi:MAG TPA: DNA-processing protein DprA [Solirubrobacteraceae bacterium]|nr:DNA-processing protein DprA [Solirubrobacteraceae bacterium]